MCNHGASSVVHKQAALHDSMACTKHHTVLHRTFLAHRTLLVCMHIARTLSTSMANVH